MAGDGGFDLLQDGLETGLGMLVHLKAGIGGVLVGGAGGGDGVVERVFGG